jgi:hypothetical protein
MVWLTDTDVAELLFPGKTIEQAHENVLGQDLHELHLTGIVRCIFRKWRLYFEIWKRADGGAAHEEPPAWQLRDRSTIHGSVEIFVDAFLEGSSDSVIITRKVVRETQSTVDEPVDPDVVHAERPN